MKRPKLNTTASLTVIALGALVLSPLVRNDIIAFTMRSTGFVAGAVAVSRKTDDEVSYIEAETKRLELEREEMTKRYLAETEQLEAWVDAEKERLTLEANNLVLQGKEEAIKVVDDVLAELEMVTAHNQELQERLLCYQLPKMPHGTSRVEVIAGRIIEFYYQQGILADYVDSWTENEYDLIRIKPRSGAKEQFHKLADELQLELRLDRSPVVSLVQGSVQIKVDTRCIDTRIKTDEPKVIEAPTNYLEIAVKAAPSFRINGESGSGKSTLAMNLIATMRNELGGCDVTLIDPKYPLSEWDFIPKYRGIDEAYAGLEEAAQLVETRLKLAREDKENGKELRNFKPALYVVDEIDWVINHYGVDAANLLRTTLKVGRALKVMILYLGQTPLCSRLKMNRDDFRHSANFYLGENVPAGIDEVVHSSALKHDLESQYTLRQESDNKYFALVKYPGKSAFIASLPKPFIQPNIATAEMGTSRNSEIKMVPVSSEAVPDEVTASSGQISASLRDIATSALKDGHSKAHIIKELWEMKGRRYVEGQALWDTMQLD